MKLSIFAGVAAALVSMVAAQVQLPGNAVYTPNLSAPAVAGTPTEIKFDGTGLKTVSLILLKGPSTNVLPIGTIASGIAVHDGDNFFSWTPGTDLENLPTEGYGIKLVDDATGNFQYSTQFGIKNDAVEPVESSIPVESSAPVVPTKSASIPDDSVPTYGGEAPAVTSTASVKPQVNAPTVVYSTEYETLTSCDCTETPAVPVPEVPAVSGASSGLPVVPTYTPGTPGSWNSTTPEAPAAVPSGTGVPSSYYSSPSSPPQFTGAADRVQAGGLLIAVALGFVALF